MFGCRYQRCLSLFGRFIKDFSSGPASLHAGVVGRCTLLVLAYHWRGAYWNYGDDVRLADVHNAAKSLKFRNRYSMGFGLKLAHCEEKTCKVVTDPKDCVLTAECEAKIRNEINSYPVVLFIKGSARNPTCKYSKQALRLLMACKVETIRTVDVLKDPELRQGLKKFSNYPYIPQLYVNGKFIGGLEKMNELFENGTLTDILNVAPQSTRKTISTSREPLRIHLK